MDESIDLAIERLKGQLSEIKLKISQCRKRGAYTKIAELKIEAIPSKIMMLEITKEYKDAQKVDKLISDARAEIINIEKEGK